MWSIVCWQTTSLLVHLKHGATRCFAPGLTSGMAYMKQHESKWWQNICFWRTIKNVPESYIVCLMPCMFYVCVSRNCCCQACLKSMWWTGRRTQSTLVAMTCRSLLYRYLISTSTHKTNYPASETDDKNEQWCQNFYIIILMLRPLYLVRKLIRDNNSSLAESKLLDAAAFAIMVIKNYTWKYLPVDKYLPGCD